MLLLLLILVLVVIVVLWRRRTAQKRRQIVLRQLRNWLGTQEVVDPSLQRWLNSLSASEANVLLDLLVGYCTSLNWELTWLFTSHLEKTPLLKQAVEEGIMAYARAILTSLQLVEDVQAYRAYLSMLQKPTGRQQYTLIRKLYQAFSEQGMIRPLPNKRQWLRRPPTRKQTIAAVVSAFELEPTRAMTILKNLLVMEAEVDVQQLTGARLTLAGQRP